MTWQTVVCVASGPSLTVEQCEIARQARREGRCRIVVVNNSWQRAPDADILYAADGAWIKEYHADVRNRFDGECWTQDHAAAEKYGWHWVEPVLGNHLLPRDDQRITLGSNGGFQAIMVARLRGARRILLIGYDLKLGEKGRLHWHGMHPGTLSNGDPKGFIKHFAAVAPALAKDGVECINCTITSALTCFRRADLQQSLTGETECATTPA